MTIDGTLASVSTLLITVGLPQRPAAGWKRRTEAWKAALALDALHQRSLFAADVGPGPASHVDAQAPAAAQDILA